MIIYDILLILKYQASMMDLIVVFCIASCLYLCLLFLCFGVATEFSVNKDLYIATFIFLAWNSGPPGLCPPHCYTTIDGAEW